ncbi:YtpI family protein [Cohnella nanjingensis]|uniref:YtpI family protein n=1 Tax=Cohnella nanjingensis TaxID=1387779 RepID=UPI0035E41099
MSTLEATAQWVLFLAILASLILSVVFSYRSRRNADQTLRGLYGARMNICMGLMLIFLAILQMFIYSGSTLRVIVGALFLVLGIFNLFAGLRNHSHFKRRRSSAP